MHDHSVTALRVVARRNRVAILLIGATLGVSFSSGGATAQQHHLSVGAGWYNPGGDDFRATESGSGRVFGVRVAVNIGF